jgi:hypothetical protein
MTVEYLQTLETIRGIYSVAGLGVVLLIVALGDRLTIAMTGFALIAIAGIAALIL